MIGSDSVAVSSSKLHVVDDDLEQLRRLVVRLPIVAGETLSSYLDRLAEFYDVPLRTMLKHVGICSPEERYLPPGYGILLSTNVAHRLSYVTGLLLEDIKRSLLGALQGIAFEAFGEGRRGMQKIALAEGVFIRGSQFCPHCLSESGGVWLTLWKLPCSFVCLRHRIFLYDRCPECGKRPRSRFGRGGRVPTPMFCNNSVPPYEGAMRNYVACGCSFIELPGIAAPKRFISAQISINLKINEGLQDSKGGSLVYLQDLRLICQLLWGIYEVSDFETNSRPMLEALKSLVDERRSCVGLDAGRRIVYPAMGVLVRAAAMERSLQLIERRTGKNVGGQLPLIVDRLESYGASGNDALRGLPAWLKDAIHRLRISGHDRFIKMLTDSRGVTVVMHASYQARHIPQLFPKKDFARFRPYLYGVREELARQFCSMSAVKLLGMSWKDVVKSLELPAGAERRASQLLELLDSREDLKSFGRELISWARNFGESESKVDYQLRREALRSLKEISMATWKQICRESGIRVRRRSAYAAAWLWADCTSGDWRRSPALKAVHPRSTARYERAVANTLSLVKSGLRREAARRLEAWNAAVAAQ